MLHRDCRIELEETTILQLGSFNSATSGLCCNSGPKDAWVTNLPGIKPLIERVSYVRRGQTSPVLDGILKL